MQRIRQGEPPINTLFKYEINDNDAITIDLSDFQDKRDHLAKIKNSIIYSIILFSKNMEHTGNRLKHVNFVSQNNKLMEEKFLPLIFNHSRYFDLTYTPILYSDGWKLPDKWLKLIKKIKRMNIEEARNYVFSQNIKGSEEFLFYKAVSDSSPLQIRYMGYQIGKWNSKEKKIVPVNNKTGKSFIEHAQELIESRSDPTGKEYNNKEEHFLESIILKSILDGERYFNDYKISPLFTNSVCFQFPVLLKPGDSTSSGNNSSKYVDILAKTANRPVIMELKVWNKNKNSRGEYMFSALSQVFSYYNYLDKIFSEGRTQLEGLEELNWLNPLIFVIINDIGNDERSENFRNYIRYIKSYINKNIEFYFIEIDNQEWQNRRVKEKNII